MHYHHQMGAKYCISATVHLKIYSEFKGNYGHSPQNPGRRLTTLKNSYFEISLSFNNVHWDLPGSICILDNGAFKCKYYQPVIIQDLSIYFLHIQAIPLTSQSQVTHSHTNHAIRFAICYI